jgi:hypothetical protein
MTRVRDLEDDKKAITEKFENKVSSMLSEFFEEKK